ncbi:MAG: glycosyl transferase [Candidatus Uhrbacteria bacterium]|jgi:glycosyltransferase involved in cell wall biosynthesis
MLYDAIRFQAFHQDMRIAMIGVKGVPAAMTTGGGIERHVEQLAPRLAGLGHEVTVYVRHYANPRGTKRWNGCTLVTLPTIRRKYLEAIVHVFLSTLHALRQKYDIIHYHGVGPSTLSWIPRVFAPRCRVVVTFHSRDQFHEKWNIIARAYLAWGEWTAVRFPHATIAVSHVIQQFCIKLFGVKPFFIPNGVEIPSASIGSDRMKTLGLEPGRYFLGLGRLIPHKAFDDAIRAFRNVPTAMSLAIAGAPGYDMRYAEELYALAELDPRVRLLGFRTGEDLQQLLAHCYAYVCPSRSEGLSIAVLEAMSHGKVVLMSNIPENLELIDHSGMSYEVGNIQDLTRLFTFAAREPALLRERGERARHIVKLHFSWDSIVRQTDSVYESLKA